jgi:ribosome biogenesis protein
MEEIRVQFVTAFSKFRVTDAPFAVPSKLTEKGLSDVISHLLELSTPMPFLFLIDGQLLRTSLKKHLATAGISEVRLRFVWIGSTWG